MSRGFWSLLLVAAVLTSCKSKEEEACDQAKDAAFQAWATVAFRTDEDLRVSIELAQAVVKANPPTPGDTDVGRALRYFDFASRLGEYQKTSEALGLAVKDARFQLGGDASSKEAATKVEAALAAHRTQARQHIAGKNEGVDLGGDRQALEKQLSIAREVAESDAKGELKKQVDAALAAHRAAVGACGAVTQ
ncbi:MAG: hypothetical protein JRI68_24535 [Deltaproteobacteria bacterium]|nr:hypothetical protein [Deltaproteobacteria bacterium]